MSTYPTEAQIIAAVTAHRSKLEAVGDAEQLAIHFAGSEMRAVCSSPTRCALAESFTTALREAFGEQFRMTVGVTVAAVEQLYSDKEWYVVTDDIALTPEMTQFIRNFDGGNYPELVK